MKRLIVAVCKLCWPRQRLYLLLWCGYARVFIRKQRLRTVYEFLCPSKCSMIVLQQIPPLSPKEPSEYTRSAVHCTVALLARSNTILYYRHACLVLEGYERCSGGVGALPKLLLCHLPENLAVLYDQIIYPEAIILLLPFTLAHRVILTFCSWLRRIVLVHEVLKRTDAFCVQ